MPITILAAAIGLGKTIIGIYLLKLLYEEALKLGIIDIPIGPVDRTPFPPEHSIYTIDSRPSSIGVRRNIPLMLGYEPLIRVGVALLIVLGATIPG